LKRKHIEVCRVIFMSVNFEKAILCRATIYTLRAYIIHTEVISLSRKPNLLLFSSES